ncbi:hypothetical protein C485_03323 [Natrinema altunense JCM 12890]|uniref:Uncharacterized protein n=1 Tax=Natrinema altunense (strain JCM 12890 / CGMCC 1.3731 / AJ2) TaxID=1227494 RepID=L9ZVG0_NATA2|nr:hypothetical protein C485_03323 [Natrinema altunense JCM 12890]
MRSIGSNTPADATAITTGGRFRFVIDRVDAPFALAYTAVSAFVAEPAVELAVAATSSVDDATGRCGPRRLAGR